MPPVITLAVVLLVVAVGVPAAIALLVYRPGRRTAAAQQQIKHRRLHATQCAQARMAKP